ncbi:MAG: aldo/keto reductase [Anaerolineae bacterium]|nr:aldo/keto reductase [Anaerolineae bacterium]
MKTRTLGKTGLRTSVVGVGTWQFGGEWGRSYTQPEADAILSRAKARGINLIDTAECYGDHVSERLVGDFLRRDNREDWIIATKFGHRFTANFTRDELWSADDVRQQLEDSLRALHTDFIDLYQFHSGDDAAFDNDDLWTMLAKQVEAGKIRHLGISISSQGDRRHQVQQATAVGASAIQVVYNRLEREPEAEILPLCIEQNLGVLARVPLASGFLSGKYRPGAQFTNKDDVRSLRDQEKITAQLREVEAIQRDEVPEGVPMAAWALAWCLQHPAVSCVIPGCKTPEQVDSNADAAELDLIRPDHPQAV